MGANWKDFFFGAVDPNGTVSLDKLPGAFWVQALFVRVFGFHFWVVALPQVIAGVLTILVLYRVVRRLAGPKAGLVAAVIMAASPVTALLNRGNVSDPLFVLLVVLAADATVSAIVKHQPSGILVAGLWVGLAFQTKMLQTWLVVPALFLAYLVAGPPVLRRRVLHTALAGAVIVIVSLSWMTVVTAVPAHDRPYVDGTTDNSVYAQVFVYNGWTRLGVHIDGGAAVPKGQPFLAAIQRAEPEVGTDRIRASVDRLLVGPFGRDDGWLLPVALLSATGVLINRRSATRRDPMRAGVILWGSWLVILLIVFSKTTPLNSYYTASLIPAVAALCATGLALSWRSRTTSPISRLVLLLAVPLTTLYGLTLVPFGSGSAWWVLPLAGAVCVAAEVALIVSLRRSEGTDPLPSGIAIALSAVSMLLLPAVTTGIVVADGFGSFSTPYQSAAATAGVVTLPEKYQTGGAQVAADYSRFPPGTKAIAAVDSTAIAAPLIMATGREWLPIGGYLGSNPSPTLAQLRDMVNTEGTVYFYIPIVPPGPDPRLAWVRKNCFLTYRHREVGGVEIGGYNCS